MNFIKSKQTLCPEQSLPNGAERTKAKKDWLCLCGIQAAYWSVMTMQSSFLVSFLQQNGYRSSVTALIIFIMALINLVAQPVWGYFADSEFGIRKVMICCLAGTIPSLVFMPAAVGSIVVTFLLNILYSIFNYPLQGLTDSITNISETRNQFVSYGFTRGCGSLCAALSSYFIGSLLNLTGIDAIFYINAALTAVALILMLLFTGTAYGAPAVAGQTDEIEDAPKISVRIAISKLLRNRAYVLLVIGIMLLNTGNRLAHLYVPIMINDLGGTSYHLGLALFLNCILMAPCMVLHSFLIREHISNRIPMTAAALFAVARILSMAIVRTLGGLVAVQILESFAYGLMQPATVRAVSEVSPLYLRATAISFAIAVEVVLSTFIGNNLGSMMASVVGVIPTFYACGALTALGLVIYLCGAGLIRPGDETGA